MADDANDANDSFGVLTPERLAILEKAIAYYTPETLKHLLEQAQTRCSINVTLSCEQFVTDENEYGETDRIFHQVLVYNGKIAIWKRTSMDEPYIGSIGEALIERSGEYTEAYLVDDLTLAVGQLFDEAEKLASYWHEDDLPLLLGQPEAEEIAKRWENWVRAYEDAQKWRLPNPKRGGDRRKKADLTMLLEHYEQHIEIWQESFRMCRESLGSHNSERRQNWRRDLNRYFATLPDDLIERLQPMSNWSDKIAAICSEQGGEDRPEDIALEHAARLCGAPNYAYKLSSLREMHRKQRAKNQM